MRKKKDYAPESLLKIHKVPTFSNFYNIWGIWAENNRTGRKKRRDVTASPEVLCSQVHAVRPLLCRIVQLFSLAAPPRWKQKTSVGERKTENRHTKRDIEVSHDFSHIQKTSSEGKAEGKRGMDGHNTGRGRSAQIQDIMSNWSDTRERGRQRWAERQTQRHAEREKPLWNLSQQSIIIKLSKKKSYFTRSRCKCRNLKDRTADNITTICTFYSFQVQVCYDNFQANFLLSEFQFNQFKTKENQAQPPWKKNFIVMYYTVARYLKIPYTKYLHKIH